MARRRKSRGRKKAGIVGMARGGIYAGIPALQTYSDYKALVAAGRSPSDAVKQSISRWGGISPSTGSFDTSVIVAQYTPLAAWTAVDMVAGKLGVWRRMSRLLKF